MLQEIENGRCAEDLKMDVLQAIRFTIQGWDEVKANTIRNCWYHTKILSADENDSDSSSLEDFRQTTDPIIDDIANVLESLGLPDPMTVEEYLAIPEENIVYEVLTDNQIIMELVETFRTNDPIGADLEDADDSLEIPIVSADIATASLKTVLTFLF